MDENSNESDGRKIVSLNELKEIELGVLKVVADFCEENDLSYYLAYGTLLGAIRHHGFIPWDDDIDIWMFRADYEVFLDIFPKQSESMGIRVNSYKTTDNYNRVFAKIYDARTYLRETTRCNDFDEGVFIDVFPIETVPANKIQSWWKLNCLQFGKIKLLGKSWNNAQGLSLSLPKKLARFLFKNIDENKTLRKFEGVANKAYKCDNALCSLTNPQRLGRQSIFDSSLFDPALKVAFEDREYPVPNGYDALLTSLYGNYMELPPVELQKPHHEFEACWR